MVTILQGSLTLPLHLPRVSTPPVRLVLTRSTYHGFDKINYCSVGFVPPLPKLFKLKFSHVLPRPHSGVLLNRCLPLLLELECLISNDSFKPPPRALDLALLLSLRRVADELAFVGAPVSDDDLTMAVLNGLGPEFNSFVAAITANGRRDPLNFTDIHGLLLSHEALLQHQLSTMGQI